MKLMMNAPKRDILLNLGLSSCRYPQTGCCKKLIGLLDQRTYLSHYENFILFLRKGNLLSLEVV